MIETAVERVRPLFCFIIIIHDLIIK